MEKPESLVFVFQDFLFCVGGVNHLGRAHVPGKEEMFGHASREVGKVVMDFHPRENFEFKIR